MALIPFAPPPGLNSDDTTFGAEGAWADGSNVRFHQGRPQVIGGSVSKFDLGSEGAVDLFAFTRSGTHTVVYGTPTTVYVGTALSSATSRLSGVGALGGFSFATWGNTLLAAPRRTSAANGGTLYEQSGSSAAAAVTEAPDRIDAGIIVTPQRQVLAFATNEEGGTHNPLCIRGSDIEDYSSAGSWTSTSANNAFEHILDGPGAIICARQVGAYVAVWTNVALHLGQYIGDPGQTYRFDKVADGPPPMSQRATAELNGVVYWVATDHRMRAWTPGSHPQVVSCPILQDLVSNGRTPDGNSYLVAIPRFNEVWYFYVDERDGSIVSRYVAYAPDESAAAQRAVWFRGSLARSAMLDSEIVRALDTTNVLSTIATDEDGQVYSEGAKVGVGTAPDSYIQSADRTIDNSQRRVMIRSFIPDFEYQSGNVSLTVFVRDRPQSTAVTKGPFTISTSATKKDFRASGKIAAVRLSGTAVYFRLGKPLFDVVPLGER